MVCEGAKFVWSLEFVVDLVGLPRGSWAASYRRACTHHFRNPPEQSTIEGILPSCLAHHFVAILSECVIFYGDLATCSTPAQLSHTFAAFCFRLRWESDRAGRYFPLEHSFRKRLHMQPGPTANFVAGALAGAVPPKFSSNCMYLTTANNFGFNRSCWTTCELLEEKVSRINWLSKTFS